MEVDQIIKISLAWELFTRRVPQSHIANQIAVNRDTVRLWINAISTHPDKLLGFLEDYRSAKKGPRLKRKLDGLLKQRIWKLRDDNRECCGQKIRRYLWDEYQTDLSVKTIYKVLGEKYQLRTKWKKNQTRGPVPQADKPREVVQMDTVDFGYVFAFTGIDIFSKDASVLLLPSLTSLDGLHFLEYSMGDRFKHTDMLQVDGGPEFKGEFKQNVFRFADRFRNARPYKKNEQSYIESFNRSLRKECLGWIKYSSKDIPMLQKEVNDYLNYYHTKRAHLGLNLQTPNDILTKYLVPDI